MDCPRVIYVDLRCLQDAAFAERGVGFHSAGLLRHARRWLDQPIRLIGLTDTALPPLKEAYRALVDKCLPSLKPRPSREPAAFIQLSPATHPQWRVGSLLGQDHVLSCAVAYDFIPLANRAYSPTAASRLGYCLTLLWLKQF